MSVQTQWKHLEPRPGKQTSQLYLRGRNMKVWHLVQPIVVRGVSPEEMAEDYELPLEAVLEALDYFGANEQVILAQVEEEGRSLREAGLLQD